jgi:hypothetical protein
MTEGTRAIQDLPVRSESFALYGSQIRYYISLLYKFW